MISASRRPPAESTRRPEPARPAGPPGWVAPVLGMLGLCGLLFFQPQVSRVAATWGWRPAPATLVTIQRQISPASFSSLFSRQHGKLRLFSRQQDSITYSYSVNGHPYLGSDVVSELPRGKLTIYYDPDQPDQSVARRSAAIPILAGFAVAVGLIVYGVRGLRQSRRKA